MASVLPASFGDKDPEWIRETKAKLREVEALDAQWAEREAEALKNGDIRKLNFARGVRQRLKVERQHRTALIKRYERDK